MKCVHAQVWFGLVGFVNSHFTGVLATTKAAAVEALPLPLPLLPLVVAAGPGPAALLPGVVPAWDPSCWAGPSSVWDHLPSSLQEVACLDKKKTRFAFVEQPSKEIRTEIMAPSDL